MKTMTVKCPHGAEVSIQEDTDRPLWMFGDAWRLFVRDTLLACPACRGEADKWIEEAGA